MRLDGLLCPGSADRERPSGRAWDLRCPWTWVSLSASRVSLILPSVFLPSSPLYPDVSQNGVVSEPLELLSGYTVSPVTRGVWSVRCSPSTETRGWHVTAAQHILTGFTFGVPPLKMHAHEDQCPLPLSPRPCVPPYHRAL